jgi:trans-feruloyl-CoA hydratase/vanillin synthase
MSSTYETVKVEHENGIAWVILNRPDKRNAMSPQLHYDMCEVLDELEQTIAMVNGFCFGGGFTQLIACDFAIAAEDAQFGLSEVNWGILPGGFVSKALVEALGMRDAVWFAVTGETFDGRVAERARLVNRAVPREQLRAETVSLAERLMKINPEAIRATKQAVKNVRNMSDDAAVDYLAAKSIELRFLDREKGRDKGMSQFLDEKTYRPGIQPYSRPSEKAS